MSDSFSSMKEAANYFNVDYRSILKNLDTKLATRKGGILVLLFSHELSQQEKESLLNNMGSVQIAKNETAAIWVYKRVKNKLILLDNNNPTYSSRLEASKGLKMSFVCGPRQGSIYKTCFARRKTINKYLDSNQEYKGLYFYSVAQ